MVSLLAVAVQLLLCGQCIHSKEQNVLFQDNHLDDHQFTEGIIFTETGIKSSLECARLCSANSSCKAFTFSPKGFCRAYDAVMTSESPSTSARGAMTYSRRVSWLKKVCASDENCSVADSTCFKGECLCSPGRFYSVSSQTCVTSCSRANMQDTYVIYSDALLVIGKMDSAGQTVIADTPEQCQSLCNTIEVALCVATVYDHQNRCEFWGPAMPISMPKRLWMPNFASYNFSLRMCA
ncbi:hypothetical protein ACOMHN_027653 [Nucella lapillus]